VGKLYHRDRRTSAAKHRTPRWSSPEVIDAEPHSGSMNFRR
jgi:hypothetical protein